MHVYDTVSEAVKGLKSRGFTEDFNLKENCIICNQTELKPEDFEITEFYRFEGNTDPGDEAVVYGIESHSGMKGVLVNAYGYQSETMSNEIAKKLSIER